MGPSDVGGAVDEGHWAVVVAGDATLLGGCVGRGSSSVDGGEALPQPATTVARAMIKKETRVPIALL
jgi:hypothetical protein